MVFRYRFRLYLLTIIFVAGVVALLVKLWKLQIDQYEFYAAQIPGTSNITVRIPGVRGEIKDRNGITLVTNEPNFEVLFNLKDIVDAYAAEHGKVPKHERVVTVNGMLRPREEDDVVRIVNETIIPGLEELGLAAAYNSSDLRSHYREFGGVEPWVYRSDLTFREFATYAEHNLGLPGVSVAVRPKRRYVYDALAAHILGMVRQPDITKVPKEEIQQFDFYVGDDQGAHGIEAEMDAALRGRPGKRILLKDEKGRIVGELGTEEAGKGSDIYLTIDARIQAIAEQALREAGVGRGAAVVIEPATGDILAMASVPSFNPNKFIPAISVTDFKAYEQNPTKPFMNQAVQAYPPGSTCKIPVALAGCYAGIGTRRFSCSGGQQFGNKFMKCWIYTKSRGSHGSLALDDSIKVSCNHFYYQYGNACGINNIKLVGQMLGLGERSGIPIQGESAGLLPDPDWVKVTYGTGWTAADTARTAIGQGYMEATPLQMASVTATVAMAGIRHRPWLVSKVVSGEGEVEPMARPVPLDLTKEGLDPEAIELVRRGMWKVVNDAGGTAKAARSEGYETAGKTGTAQDFREDENGRRVEDNRAWFIAFAPYDEPKFALCVMVGNGKSGGGVAAPVAARIIKESMALSQGLEIELEPLEESAGHFEHLELVSYGEDRVADFLGDEDGDTGEQLDAIPSRPRKRQTVTIVDPSVQLEADDEGSAAIPRAEPVLKSTRYKPADSTSSGSPDRSTSESTDQDGGASN